MMLPPLAAETLFHLGPIPITNSLINTTLTMVGFIIFAFVLQSQIRKTYPHNFAPKGLLNLFEAIIEILYSYFDQVTGSRAKTNKFLPIVGTFFFFILLSNWMGLMPGTGSIGIWQLHHGEVALIPLFRPSNSDLNMTLAMAVFAVSLSHFFGIITIGFFKYLNKFIKLKDVFTAVISFNPVKILVAVIEFFVGLIEVFSEIAKMVSLSLRLYGNIFAGEVLLTVIAGLLALFVPLPFMGLELIVGLIQAVVFAMLTLVYLNMATAEIHDHDAKEQHTSASDPAKNIFEPETSFKT